MLKDKIVTLCKQKGVTQQQMLADTGIGNGTIDRWDKKHSPTLTTLKKVADYFEIPLCEIADAYYEGDDDG